MQNKRDDAVPAGTFGQRVKARREQVKWTQQQLSDRLGGLGVKLDTSAITRIESGTREPRLREAQAIAGALGVLLDDLLPAEPDELVARKLLGDLEDAKFGLVDLVYDYGTARRALIGVLSDLDMQGISIDQREAMLEATTHRAIADWREIKADVDRRTVSRNPPYDESIFDAEA